MEIREIRRLNRIKTIDSAKKGLIVGRYYMIDIAV
jgi:hypothetical protein